MTREFSTYLNLLRLTAAMAVFLGHCAWLWTPGHFRLFMAHGWISPVLTFFVLSGFVIGHTVDHKDRSGAEYAVNRAARIYSVALPALVVTFALDAVGRHFAPTLYSAAWGYSSLHPVKQFLRSLLFVNEIWWSRSMPGSNGPFWSLAYEVWYYLAFGLFFFGHRWIRIPAVALALAMAGPWVSTLFPIWLLGLGAYRIVARRAVDRRLGWLLAASGLAMVAVIETWATQIGLRSPPAPIFAHRGEVGLDYAIATGFAVHLVGMHTVAPALGRVLLRIASPVGWMAGATFTLYLFHFPIAQCLAALNPWPPACWTSVFFVVGGTLLVVLAVAEVTERRKEPWRRLFAALLHLTKTLALRLHPPRPA